MNINYWLLIVLCKLMLNPGVLILGQERLFFMGYDENGISGSRLIGIDSLGTLKSFDWISPNPSHSTINGLFDRNNNPFIYTNGCFLFDNKHMPIHSNSLLAGTDLNEFCHEHGSVLKNSAQLMYSPRDSNEILLIFGGGDKRYNGIPTFKYLEYAKINLQTKEFLFTETIHSSSNLTEFDVTRHKNGRNFWIAFADLQQAQIILAQLDDSGVVNQIVVPFEFLQLSEICNHHIQISFSNDGEKLMIFSGKCFLALFDFDNCSGELFNFRINVNIHSNIYGKNAAFTLDDNFIYVEKEYYRIVFKQQSYFSQVEIYETSKIGVKVIPNKVLDMPQSYTKGTILFYSNLGALIFNKYGSKYFLKFDPTDASFENANERVSIEDLPYFALPALSKPAIHQNLIDNCLTRVDNVTLTTVNVYPNPASRFIQIEFNNGNDIQNVSMNTRIYDQSGHMVLSKPISLHENRIDIESIPAGIYVITILEGNRLHAAKKIVIVH